MIFPHRHNRKNPGDHSSSSIHQMDMTTGSLFAKMLLYTVPLILSSLLQLLFNAADVIVVGRFAGPNSLAAVGSTTSLITLLTNLFIGLSVGVNVLVARFLGSHREREIHETVQTAITMSLVCGLGLALVSIPLARQFLTWMSSPTDVISLSTLYLRIYFCGMPALMLYNFGTAILNAMGETRKPLLYLSLSGVVNILLNLFTVILLDMDVAGVAIATVVSQCISAFLVLRLLYQSDSVVHWDLKDWHLDPDKCKAIIRIGLPAGFQGCVFSISNVVIQSSVNSFGSTIMAGNAAAQNIEYFVYAPIGGFYQSATTFASQNFGAGKRERLDQTLLVSLLYSILFSLLFSQVVIRNNSFFLGIYSSDPAVIQAGITRFSYVCFTYWICAIMDILCGVIRGMGFSVIPMVVSLLGACAFRLIWIATYFRFHHSIENLYVSYPISWILTSAVHIVCFILLRRRQLKMRQV